MSQPSRFAPTTIEALVDWLRSRPGRVRVEGLGSQPFDRVEVAGATRLATTGLARIERLDPGDQTCSVQCGLPREALDEALRTHGLELPCLGGGTIGGLFASDPFGPAAGTALGPRNLLLGMDAVLADGTAFKSGARVVKSVAGFDVHKVFVGSRGRLLVATRLHLRLKPRPRADAWFANGGLDLHAALALVRALRTDAEPPAVLLLRRTRDGGHEVAGRLVGRAAQVAGSMRRHALAEADPLDATVPALPGEEVVHGLARPSQLEDLVEALPHGAAFCWLGGGRFHTALPSPASTDALLTKLVPLRIQAHVARAVPDRLRVGTPLDPGQQQLTEALERALDPDGILV